MNQSNIWALRMYCVKLGINSILKSLNLIGRRFYGHGKKDGFVLYVQILTNKLCFCYHTNINTMKTIQRKTENSKPIVRGVYGVHLVSYMYLASRTELKEPEFKVY